MNFVEILYDHYRETFSLSKAAQERRNKSFIYLCILEALAFFIVIDPENMFKAMKSYEKLAGIVCLGHDIIQTLLWIMIAYILIRYVQDMIYVERQYNYLDKMEKRLSDKIEENIFRREGENYLKEYPKVLNLIDLFYKMLMPVLFLIINIFHIVMEWQYSGKNILSAVCDTVLFLAIFIITWFYFFWIHSKITEYWEKKIPLLKKMDNWLSRELKKV